MARAWRIEYADTLYLVLSRGNDRCDIFFDDSDRRMFLDALGVLSERVDIYIFAYVLMGNHYQRNERAFMQSVHSGSLGVLGSWGQGLGARRSCPNRFGQDLCLTVHVPHERPLRIQPTNQREGGANANLQ
jgi:hypothetical protein